MGWPRIVCPARSALSLSRRAFNGLYSRRTISSVVARGVYPVNTMSFFSPWPSAVCIHSPARQAQAAPCSSPSGGKTRGTTVPPSILGRQPHVIKRSIEAKRPAGPRIDLAIYQPTRCRVDSIGRAVGDLIRMGVRNVLPSNSHRQATPHIEGDVQVGSELGGEQLSGIVILVTERAVVVLVQSNAKRA